MADPEQLLRQAVPRLKKDDEGAQKIRKKLVRMAFAAWGEGPRRLKALGVATKRHAPLEDDDEQAGLDALHDALGDEGFVTLFRALRDELAAKLGGKKEEEKPKARSSSSGRVRTASSSGRVKKSGSSSGRVKTASSSGRVKKSGSSSGRVRRASGSGKLTMSSHDETGSAEELALPADEPVLALPPEDDGPLGIAFDDDALALKAGAPAPAKPARDAEDTDPAAAGDRALGRFRDTGDPEELEAAKKLFARAAKAAETDVARGAARAGLAQAYLLAGEVDKAKEHAEKALSLFPDEPNAVRVLLQAPRPGEAERRKVEAGLARARHALRGKDEAGAEAVARELDALLPREPFGPLVALAALHEKGAKGVDKALEQVWKRWPASPGFADLPLGPELERPVVLAALMWVRQRIEQEGGPVLEQTVKDVDAKTNVVSGAVQLALGVARSALATREKLRPVDEQELRKWIGQALLAAQYYDHAKEVLAAARAIDRNSGHVLEINKDEQQCGVMKRAFDKPGVKAKMGKLEGVGILQHRKALAARLQTVLAQKDEALGSFEQDEERIVAAVAASPERKKKVEARAKKAGQESPFSRVDAVEQELAALDAQKTPDKPAAPEAGGGGLFGRMKGGLSKALDTAKSAAKNAEVALRKGVASGKKKEAARALAVALRDRPEGGWGDAELDALIDRWRAVSSRVDALEEEADELRRLAGKAGQA